MVAFSNSNVDHLSHPSPFRGHFREGYEMVDREVVAILGADCPLGQKIAAISLNRGCEVQALTQGTLGCKPHQRLRVLASETFEERHVRTVVRGSTCVINLCNVSRQRFDPKRPTSESITRNALRSMKHAQINRYLCVTNQSVTMPSDRLGSQGLVSRYLWPLTHRHHYQDLQSEAEVISRAKASWTLVRCPTIKNVASVGTVCIDRHRPAGRFVALDRLARYLLHLRDSDAYSQSAIFVANQSVLSRYF